MTVVNRKRESPLLKRIHSENVPELKIRKTKKGENLIYFDQSSPDKDITGTFDDRFIAISWKLLFGSHENYGVDK